MHMYHNGSNYIQLMEKGRFDCLVNNHTYVVESSQNSFGEGSIEFLLRLFIFFAFSGKMSIYAFPILRLRPPFLYQNVFHTCWIISSEIYKCSIYVFLCLESGLIFVTRGTKLECIPCIKFPQVGDGRVFSFHVSHYSCPFYVES